MKRNLDDYRKEMKALETRHHPLDTKVSSEVNFVFSRKRQRSVKAASSTKWAKLMPVMMAILMAIITLIFLIISEALKNH